MRTLTARVPIYAREQHESNKRRHLVCETELRVEVTTVHDAAEEEELEERHKLNDRHVLN